jgi:hypothetical protein
MTMSPAPAPGISLLLPEHWFRLPLNPAPNPADLHIRDWDQSTTAKLTDLLSLLAKTGKAANISTAAAAIYDVGGEVTVTSVAAGYLHLPELATLADHDLTEIFTTTDGAGSPESPEPAADHGAATDESAVSGVDLPVGSAARRQRAIVVSDALPSTVIIDFVIRPTATPDTAVTLSFSAFGARPDAFIGLFDGLATGLNVNGRR